MSDLLRRHQAPLAPASWDAVDDQAREVLTANLSARKLMDVSGPHGIEHAAVNLGRLDPGRVDAGGGVFYGIRKLLPLCEVRVPFTLDLWEFTFRVLEPQAVVAFRAEASPRTAG
jgi:uncharacterized linocin/CFP29 family protein